MIFIFNGIAIFFIFSPLSILLAICAYEFMIFILVALTHGMETAFFRFVNKDESKEKAFSTAFYSILFVVLIFILIDIEIRHVGY